MVEQVTVFVPASIANLGCGFDIMGMAVESAGDIVSMEVSDGDGIEIINRTDYDIPSSVEDNVMTPSIRAMLAAAGVRKHLKITLMCKIMPGSGIGSSAASAPIAHLRITVKTSESRAGLPCGSAFRVFAWVK